MISAMQKKDKLTKEYIPIIERYLEGKIDLDSFWKKFYSIYKVDPSIFSEDISDRYSEETTFVLCDIHADLYDVDEHPEEDPETNISEQELRSRCTKNLAKLVELTEAL